jgi:hypothetical protein
MGEFDQHKPIREHLVCKSCMEQLIVTYLFAIEVAQQDQRPDIKTSESPLLI